jgi:hypothetical protein
MANESYERSFAPISATPPHVCLYTAESPPWKGFHCSRSAAIALRHARSGLLRGAERPPFPGFRDVAEDPLGDDSGRDLIEEGTPDVVELFVLGPERIARCLRASSPRRVGVSSRCGARARPACWSTPGRHEMPGRGADW